MNIKHNFSRFSTFIFDLDGTVWRWDKLIPDVKQTIASLQKKKKQVLFITNNTILSRHELARKLWRFGIDASYNQVVNAGLVAAKYFKQKLKANESVFAISDGLREDLRTGKVKTTNSVTAEHVIVGHDLKFDYMKLLTATEALRRGAKLYATARGKYFVVGNDIWPGTGVLVESVEYASGKKAKLLGKPSAAMQQAIREVNKSRANKTVLIGDELKSDIAIGKRLGYYAVLVRTGVDKTTRVKGKMKPDAILKSAASIKV